MELLLEQLEMGGGEDSLLGYVTRAGNPASIPVEK